MAGDRKTQRFDASRPGDVAKVAAILRSGGIAAFPTETVYGLGADGLNAAAVTHIFEAKGRPADNPLILHVTGAAMLEGVVGGVPPVAYPLMDAFWPGPLTLVMPAAEAVPRVVTGGGATVAVRCPDHPVALALIEAVGRPLAAPSANRSGWPSPTTPEDVLEDLDGRIDAILDGGPTGMGLESTVVDLVADPPRLLRPGALPAEALAPFLPGLQPAFASLPASAVPPSPGMKYAHYAPRAPLVLVEGTPGAVAACVLRLAAEAEAKPVGVLATVENAAAYQGLVAGGALMEVAGARDDLAGVARGLFRCLRTLDRRGARLILAEGVPREGLGLAVMDRLTRAAVRVVHAGGDGP